MQKHQGRQGLKNGRGLQNQTKINRKSWFPAIVHQVPTCSNHNLALHYSNFGKSTKKQIDQILSTWKLNAFTCFAASSWGERIVEVDACGVQLVFGKHGFYYWYFYLRFCMFGIYLMWQFHWGLDCVGFCPFEIWRCDCDGALTFPIGCTVYIVVTRVSSKILQRIQMVPPKKSKFWNLESTAEAGPSVAMPMDLHSSVRHLAINGQAKAILASSNNYPLDPCGKHTKNLL